MKPPFLAEIFSIFFVLREKEKLVFEEFRFWGISFEREI